MKRVLGALQINVSTKSWAFC